MTGGKSQEPKCYETVYLSLGAVAFTSTSSHMCGSWYLPIFLFRDGLLTLIRIASFMDLTMLWLSLPTILKLSIDQWCCNGHGWLRVHSGVL